MQSMFVTEENIGALREIYADRPLRVGDQVPEPYYGWDWLYKTMMEVWAQQRRFGLVRKVNLAQMRKRYPVVGVRSTWN